MRARLIVDCCGRSLSALLVTADGELVPCSQEIRHVATRHVSADILFDPRVADDPDFVWEDALEPVAKATAHNFFQRARRIGLRRPWDPQASADMLQLASPLSVLSSPNALADRVVGKSIPAVAFALLDALLEPTFAFLADRRLQFGDVEPIVIVSGQTGRAGRLVLQELFRRRGFPCPTIVRGEIAAAMGMIEEAPCELVVVDASDDDLHLHRVAIEGDAEKWRFRTVVSTTIRGFGWSHWAARIAAALHTTASSKFNRALIALLIGSPDSLEPRLTHGELQAALDDAWLDAERLRLSDRLAEALAAIDAADLRRVFTGEIFAADAMVRLFGEAPSIGVPVVDHSIRGVASAVCWLAGAPSRGLVLAPSGSLRIDTSHGEAMELVPPAGIPPPGHASHFNADFRFAGHGVDDKSFLLHLLWGSDRTPAGNATLCTVPVELPGDRERELRLTVHLRRSRRGSRLIGTVDARMSGDAVGARMRFSEQMEVTR